MIHITNRGRDITSEDGTLHHRSIPPVGEEPQHRGMRVVPPQVHTYTRVLFKNCPRWKPQQKTLWMEVCKASESEKPLQGPRPIRRYVSDGEYSRFGEKTYPFFITFSLPRPGFSTDRDRPVGCVNGVQPKEAHQIPPHSRYYPSIHPVIASESIDLQVAMHPVIAIRIYRLAGCQEYKPPPPPPPPLALELLNTPLSSLPLIPPPSPSLPLLPPPVSTLLPPSSLFCSPPRCHRSCMKPT